MTCTARGGSAGRASGGSRPSDKGGGGHPDPELRGGGGHPDPELRGAVFKKHFFGPSDLILVLKQEWAGSPRAPPSDPPLRAILFEASGI